jgi:hypothetical protein
VTNLFLISPDLNVIELSDLSDHYCTIDSNYIGCSFNFSSKLALKSGL